MSVSPPRASGQTASSALNAAQRAAVEHLHGPLLVVAGAGTGKTRVIVERVLYLLRALPELAGENILAITYTRKAAAEMAARIRRQGDKRAERVGVYTFHSFCYELLRRHDEALKLLDDVDYWIFLRRHLAALKLDLFRKLSEPGRFLNAFRDFFSRCQDELVSPEDYNRYVAGLAAAFEQKKKLLGEKERKEHEIELRRQQEIARAYAAAEELLRAAQRTTFGGSLLSAVRLLESHPDLRARYQARLRYIVVDEFQDANIAQITLLHLLAGQHRNLAVVGDDDQAIYRFRGASYASFKKFAELFPDSRKITLSQNYRSSAGILRVATQLIAQNGSARFDPHKKLTAARAAGEKVQLAEVEGASTEAAFVCREIRRLHERRGRYAGIAVLYRAHLHRRALVEALTRARIPFVVRGLSILSNTLVRDLLAYLRTLNNPEDNISLARLLAIPAWGLTPEMFLDLVRRARRSEDSLAQALGTLHPRVREEHTRLGELLRLLEELRPRAGEVSLTKLFDELVDRLQLRLLPTEPDRHYLDTLVAFLRQWEQEKSASQRLPEFIEYLDYFKEAGGEVSLPEETNHRDAVQLMTAHSAKGLEFDSLFVLRLNRNDFPTPARRPLFLFPDALMKEALPPGDFHIQEERRLCYVALTRARTRLALSTLSGKRKYPSVFLDDILRDPPTARAVEPIVPPAEDNPLEGAAAAASPDTSAETLFAGRSAAACYSSIAAWALSTAGSPPAEPLALSHSGLETYRKCPLKYKFAYRWRLPSQRTPAMAFGEIMHSSVVELFRARQRRPELPHEELQHIYEQRWRLANWTFRDTYQQQGYRESGWQQLLAFYETLRRFPVKVLELEKRFRWPWEDVVLTGRIDQINRASSQTVEIVEYKTGEVRPPKVVEKSLQLALYAEAARQQLGLIPERLTLYNLSVNEPISFAPAEKNVNRALETVREVAAGIRAGEFPARPGYHCRTCDYHALCPAHEQIFPLTGTPASKIAEPSPDSWEELNAEN